MEKAYKRSEPRMLYRSPVWLRGIETPAATSSLVGETRNLSRRGMFVSVVPTMPLGTEILCELPGGREVRGRVAWIFNARTDETADLTGMGIEFVDLTTDGSLVEELVGVKLDEAQPMNIWFAGLPSPTRSIGEVTHEGIELSTSLDFLRIGNEVSVAPPELAAHEARLRGRIARVTLRTDDGPPRLQIALAVLPDLAPASLATDDERWFPEIHVVEPVPETILLGDSMAMESSVEALTALEWSDRIEVVDVLDESVPSEVVTERTERTPPPLPTRVVQTLPKEPTTSRRAQAMLFAGVVLVAFVGLVVMKLVSLGNVEHVQPVVIQAPAVEAPPVVAPPPVVEAPPVEAAPVEASKPAAPKPVEAAKPIPPKPVEVAKPVAPKPVAIAKPVVAGPWQPQVTRAGEHAQVLVPIGGSGKGLSTFTLSDPPGLAVDLPSAKPSTPLKSWLLHDATMHSLWVRARPQGGLQIRVHLAKGVHASADVTDGVLRFRTK